jgi:hypothetical protein
MKKSLKNEALISHEHLKSILEYNPDTGIFIRKTAFNQVKIGDIAGRTDTHGHRQIGVDGLKYQAHRLAWLYVYGTWPVGEVDHINGIRNDNRLCNLREVTSSQNCMNQKIRSTNKTGCKGVCWRDDCKKYRVRIMVNGKEKTIGNYEDLELAVFVAQEAQRKYHGEFARI